MYKPNIIVGISRFHWMYGYMVCYYVINRSYQEGFRPVEFCVGKLQPFYRNAGYYVLHTNYKGEGIFISNDEKSYIGVRMGFGIYQNDFFTK